MDGFVYLGASTFIPTSKAFPEKRSEQLVNLLIIVRVIMPCLAQLDSLPMSFVSVRYRLIKYTTWARPLTNLPIFAGLRVSALFYFCNIIQSSSPLLSRGVNNISNHFLVEVGVVKVVWVRSIRHVDTFLQGAYLTYFPSSSWNLSHCKKFLLIDKTFVNQLGCQFVLLAALLRMYHNLREAKQRVLRLESLRTIWLMPAPNINIDGK